MNKRSIGALLLLLLLLFIGQPLNAEASQWHTVGAGRQLNISGMALIENSAGQTSFLVVHDNKKKKQTRAGLIAFSDTGAPRYTRLAWTAEEIPVDLEAVTAISGAANNFMAITSAGKIYHIELDRKNNSLKLIRSFDAPSIPAGGNFEGFALQRIGNINLAVWAERGENSKPATLFWSRFDLQTYTFSQIASVSVKVPYPGAHVRHISDVKVDPEGRVFISSAADPGNNGPFASAVYLAGTFDFRDPSEIIFKQSPSLSRIFTVDRRKIEAFEIVPGEKGGMFFGTDDENLGSAIYPGWKKF